MARQQKKKQRAFEGFSLRNADQYADAAQKRSYYKQRLVDGLVDEAAAKENARLQSLEGWEDDAPAALQPYAFDPEIGGYDPGTGSNVGSGARLSRSGSATAFGKLFEDYGISASGTRKVTKGGFHIDKPAKLSKHPRRKTPWWLRVSWKHPDIVKEFGQVDYEMLRDFYLFRRSDEEIFEENKLVFKREARESGLQRVVSSANAVTRHRLDLVDEGNKLWGAKDPDAAKPAPEDDDLNPYGFFAAGPVIPEGFGSISCVVRGCHSYSVVPLEESGIFRPSGWYICANHGDRTQKRFVRYKALALSKLRVKP